MQTTKDLIDEILVHVIKTSDFTTSVTPQGNYPKFNRDKSKVVKTGDQVVITGYEFPESLDMEFREGYIDARIENVIVYFTTSSGGQHAAHRAASVWTLLAEIHPTQGRLVTI